MDAIIYKCGCAAAMRPSDELLWTLVEFGLAVHGLVQESNQRGRFAAAGARGAAEAAEEMVVRQGRVRRRVRQGRISSHAHASLSKRSVFEEKSSRFLTFLFSGLNF